MIRSNVDAVLHEIDHVLKNGVKLHVDRLGILRGQVDEYLDDNERLDLSNKIRGVAQAEAITEFKIHSYWGCVFMATGSGKSKVGVELANQVSAHFKMVNSDLKLRMPSYPKILISVPTKNLKDNTWKSEFTKWGDFDSWNNVEICCYASLNKYIGQSFDLVILDEGHNITPNNAVFFSNNKVAACIVLTGTKPTDQVKIACFKRLKLHPVYELSMDECVKLGLVSPYEITVITTELDAIDKYIEAGKKGKKFKTTEKKNYKYHNDTCKSAPSKFNFLKRARFIYNLRSKTIAAGLMLKHAIPDHLRTIIFCGSIEQANTLCENKYHSKTDDADFKLFLDGILNRIAVVDAVNEGVNVPYLDVAFIVQLNSSNIDLVQRIGRVVRYRPGHKGIIIILIVNETVDRDWLNKAVVGMNVSNIKFIPLQDLREGKEFINFN